MGKINEKDLLDEIRYDIQVKDPLKAGLVLASLKDVSKKTQKQALFEVSRAGEDFSIPLLSSFIAGNPEVAESFPHLKETTFSKIIDNPDILLDLLARAEDPPHRAFLAAAAGEIRLKKASPVLMDLLAGEKDLKSIESIIIALGMIGDASASGPVSEYMYSTNRDIVTASIRTLGELGTAEAVWRLADRLGGDSDLDLMILDIISKIQVPEGLEKLNEILGSRFVHLRTAAKKKLGEIGTMSIRVLLKNLVRDNPDLAIHSLNVLGDLGDAAAIPAIRKLLFNEPEDPNVRFAAYEALGRLPLDKGAFTLAAGLEDPVDNVRNAAAKAINRNYNPVLAGGVRNLIRSGNPHAIKIIVTIINSQCERIFLDLLEEDFFRDPAITYLTGKAHPEIRSRFAQLLENAGYRDLAGKVTPEKEVKGKGKLKVFAVDDSRMILTIYRTVLHNLECDSRLFEFPASALEQIRKERPDVILTDLNMPGITGIDFTKGVRKWFSKEELPIIMVTTQDEARDNEAAYSAGVNGILQKPFTEELIAKTLSKYTDFVSL